MFGEMRGVMDTEVADDRLSSDDVDVKLLDKIKQEPIHITDDEVKVETDTDIIENEQFSTTAGMEVLDQIKQEPIYIADNFSVNINPMFNSEGDNVSRNVFNEHIDAEGAEHNMIPQFIDVKEEPTDRETDCTGETQNSSDHWNQLEDCGIVVIKNEMDNDNVAGFDAGSNCVLNHAIATEACGTFGLSDMQEQVFRRDCHKINDNLDIKTENSIPTQSHAQQQSCDNEETIGKTDMESGVEEESVKTEESVGRHTQEKCSSRTTSQQGQSSATSEKKVYTCGVCNKEFIKKSSLRSHVITHTGETPFTCHFCKKGFNVRSNLNAHLLIHTGQRPHQCDTCQKTFRQAGQLKAHLLIHKGEKPYTCTECGRAFRNSSGLVTHQRTHTGEKPFVCDVCSRSFSTSTSLKTHRVTHSGKMLYDCPLCSKQFNRRNNLNVHIKRHDKNRSFSCPMCASGFVMRAHLLAHLRQSHKVDVHLDEVKYKCLMDQDGETGDNAKCSDNSVDTVVNDNAGNSDNAKNCDNAVDTMVTDNARNSDNAVETVVNGNAGNIENSVDRVVPDTIVRGAVDVKMDNGGKQLDHEFVPIYNL